MKWTEKEIEILIENYEKFGPTYVSELIERTPKMISHKALNIGLKYDSSQFYKSDDFDILVSNSNNLTDICKKLKLKLTGGNRNTIKKWIEQKNIDTSHFFIKKVQGKIKSIEEIFVEHSNSDRRLVKDKLFKLGLKERKCEECEQGEMWRNKKISLILDHINGINDDNRLENLRILCPNCNATLETHGGKNIKLKYTKLKQI